jgi:branched-chain amino acid transport system permease protein
MTATFAVLGFDGTAQTLLELVLLNVLLAYSGYVVVAGGSFSLAFVAFIGLGAYTAAILSVDHSIGFLPALILAPILAAIGALVLAKPLERLSGVYLALVSVAAISVFRVCLLNFDSLTGGALGKSGIKPRIGSQELIVGAVIVVVVFALLYRSMVGRAMRLVRADPLVAASMGVNVRRLRLWLFVGSAALGAIGGVFRAYYTGFVVPGDYGFELLITLLAMVILGGVGHWTGPLIGAALWTLLPQWLDPLGLWREVATGFILLVIILLLPQGISGGVANLVHKGRRRLQSRRGDGDEETIALVDEPTQAEGVDVALPAGGLVRSPATGAEGAP